MDLKGNGVVVQVEAAQQSDEWLLGAAQEIAEAAEARGLELPAFAGAVAVEGATDEAEATTTTEAETTTKEVLIGLLDTTSRGYSAVLDSLNQGRRKKDVLVGASDEQLAEEFEAWFTEDKLAYVTAAQEADPNVRFTLVATPNVLANSKDVTKAAKAFGENQPYSTYVWDELYGKYSAEQLSGTDPSNGKAVAFSLIPSTYTPEMGGTVVEQRAKFAKLQADNPDLKVPTVLDAVTYWQTLRAQGYQLRDNFTFDRTYIRHFDLPEQRVGRWSVVPYSCVYDDGRPYLDLSDAGGRYDARVAVG
jgi:hypothetical protein